LLSLIDTGLQIGASAVDDDDQATVALESGSDFSRSAEIALENSIGIPPTVHVHQGSRIKVFVGKDLDFSKVAGNVRR
jgi:type IV secretory pathway VirB10-like protein